MIRRTAASIFWAVRSLWLCARSSGAAAEKHRATAFAVTDPPQLAHAVVHHHAAGDFGGAFQVVLGTGRDVVEDHFLGDGAGQQHLDAAFQFRSASSGSDRPRAAACV